MNIQYPTSNIQRGKHPFDLEDRTLKFSEAILRFVAKLPQTNITRPVIDQLIRSGTSIGANYHEATKAASKKDFANKIAIAKKETKETQYWLRLLLNILPDQKSDMQNLIREMQELKLIFAASIRKSKQEN